MRNDALHVVSLRRAVNHEAAFLGGSLRQVIGGGLYADVKQRRNDVYGRNSPAFLPDNIDFTLSSCSAKAANPNYTIEPR